MEPSIGLNARREQVHRGALPSTHFVLAHPLTRDSRSTHHSSTGHLGHHAGDDPPDFSESESRKWLYIYIYKYKIIYIYINKKISLYIQYNLKSMLRKHPPARRACGPPSLQCRRVAKCLVSLHPRNAIQDVPPVLTSIVIIQGKLVWLPLPWNRNHCHSAHLYN